MFHNNSSQGTEGSNLTLTSRQDYPQWIVATSVNIFSFIFLTWILWGMMSYGIRHNKFKYSRWLEMSKRNGNFVFLSGVVAMSSCYCTLIINAVYYNLTFGDFDAEQCEITFDTLNVFYKISILLFLLFYWTRQRGLYQHPVMKRQAKHKLVRCLNLITVIILPLGSIAEVVSFVIPVQSVTSGSGCQTLSLENLTLWPIFMGVGVFAIGQIMMIVLFVFPLRRTSMGQNRQRITAMFRRSAILVFVTVVSNQAPIVIPIAIYLGPTIHGPIILFEINLMVIALCVVLSFKAYKEILLPKCDLKKAQRSPTTCTTTPSTPSKTLATNFPFV